MRVTMLALASAAVAVLSGAADASCGFCLASSDPSNQLVFDLSSLPVGPFVANDSYGDTYLLSSPCNPFAPSSTQCSGKGYQYASPAFQAISSYGCIPLGNASMVRAPSTCFRDEDRNGYRKSCFR
jgi:hypothetical protein